MHVYDKGSGSTIRGDVSGELVELTSIDAFIQQNHINSVEFIKMDIEGAERDALIGAKNIIINDKPKLAISLYHKYDDFYEIPNLILSFRPDYKLYIRHASEQLWETVLFAI